MVIARLTHDTRTLLVFSLTRYSRYIASVPHLLHTLATRSCRWLPRTETFVARMAS